MSKNAKWAHTSSLTPTILFVQNLITYNYIIMIINRIYE
jgi:hypothetical protein